MKKIKLFFSALFFICSVKSVHSQWTDMDFTDKLTTIDNMYFLDANTGFLAGDNGYINGTAPIYTRIYKTTNGGSSWTKVFEVSDPSNSQTSHSIHDIFFTSSTKGYGAGFRSYYGVPRTFFCKTNNGGTSWDTLSLSFTVDPAGIFFPSANIGYIYGDALVSSTELLKTTDGGTTWTDISAAAQTTMQYKSIKDIYFLDDNTGFAATSAGTGGKGSIYKTTDGGTTWTQLYTLPNSGDIFHSIQFINNTTGFAAASSGKIYKTTNSGSTWTATSLPVNKPVYDIYFFSAQLGYAASGDSGFGAGVYKTTNGGTSWTLDHSAFPTIGVSYKELAFVGGKGYASGLTGYSKMNNAPMGMDDLYENNASIRMYPNPAKNRITLEISENEPVKDFQLTFINVLGDEIKNVQVNDSRTSIDIDELPSGIYFYRLQNDWEIIQTGKLIID